jgi:hypothetical protein
MYERDDLLPHDKAQRRVLTGTPALGEVIAMERKPRR